MPDNRTRFTLRLPPEVNEQLLARKKRLGGSKNANAVELLRKMIVIEDLEKVIEAMR